MIDPKDEARMRDLTAMFIRRAGDDPAAFAQVYNLLSEAMALLPAAVNVLREQGFSSRDMAAELGVTPSSFRERFYRPAG